MVSCDPPTATEARTHLLIAELVAQPPVLSGQLPVLGHPPLEQLPRSRLVGASAGLSGDSSPDSRPTGVALAGAGHCDGSDGRQWARIHRPRYPYRIAGPVETRDFTGSRISCIPGVCQGGVGVGGGSEEAGRGCGGRGVRRLGALHCAWRRGMGTHCASRR